MDVEIETTFVNTFCLKNRRKRLLWELSTPGKSRNFELYPDLYLDKAYFHIVKYRYYEDMYQHLVNMGAKPICYVFSIITEKSRQYALLKDVLKFEESPPDVVLGICDPRHLAFYLDREDKKYIITK